MCRSASLYVLLATCAVVTALAFGIPSQTESYSLAKLADEKATISKMDWVLLHARVSSLERILQQDLTLPLVPTSYTYDRATDKIRINVYVNETWLAKKNVSEAAKALSDRATLLTLAPEFSGHGESLDFAIRLKRAPAEYCVINFFTPALDPAGKLTSKDVAVFENGKLILK